MKTLLLVSVLLAIVLISCGRSNQKSQVSFSLNNWDVLFTDPDEYKGAKVDLVGSVFMPPERDENGIYLQMWADPINQTWNTLVAIRDAEISIKDGDYVHVKGSVFGGFEGENMLGGKVRAVRVEAESATIVDALAIAPPAIRVYEGGHDVQTQYGLQVSLHKVEFAESETRIFLTVANNSKEEASFYSFNVKAVQGNQQFEFDFSDFSGISYPEVQSELLPGVESSGVVVLPAMDPISETRLFMDGNTSNWNLTFKPYEFVVPAK